MEKSSNKKPYNLRKTSQRAIISDEIDRISQMPDDILHYILSFVETVDVVRLSVLSKRWKSLWRTIPYLNFDIHHYKGEGTVVRDKKFQELVNRVLMNQGSTKITRFSLDCHNMFCKEILLRWINVALNRNVQELEMKFDRYRSKFELPNCNESLRVLKIYIPHSILQLRDNLNLKQLTSLYLEFMIIDFEIIPRLLSKCSLLQHLSINFFIPVNVISNILDISSSSLKCLTLNCEEPSLNYDLRISCPNLHSFTYKGELAWKYEFHNVSSLDYLCLDMLDDFSGFNLELTIKILKQVQNIRVLELLGHFMRYPTALQNLVKNFNTELHRVKFLKLSKYTQGMFYLMDIFPNLESLSIVIEEDYECSEVEDGWDNNTYDLDRYKVNEYWKYRLKLVSLINFKGFNRELEFVKFILENCCALEKLTISWSKEKKRTFTKNKQMLKFLRASSVAQVKIIP